MVSTLSGRMRADELAALAPQRGGQRLSAGAGNKGQRLYDWLLLGRCQIVCVQDQ